uniref:Uncharacterized protein n=1 Tax=Romanomermis culicivorax TaxID=13658 RepID=A0A915KDC9_ROMCU
MKLPTHSLAYKAPKSLQQLLTFRNSIQFLVARWRSVFLPFAVYRLVEFAPLIDQIAIRAFANGVLAMSLVAFAWNFDSVVQTPLAMVRFAKNVGRNHGPYADDAPLAVTAAAIVPRQDRDNEDDDDRPSTSVDVVVLVNELIEFLFNPSINKTELANSVILCYMNGSKIGEYTNSRVNSKTDRVLSPIL